MSLFVLSSKDGWVNIMYDGLDAVGVDQQVRRAALPLRLGLLPWSPLISERATSPETRLPLAEVHIGRQSQWAGLSACGRGQCPWAGLSACGRGQPVGGAQGVWAGPEPVGGPAPTRSPVLQPVPNHNPWMLLYFISFLLIVSFFVLNMFVGVVVENFHKCRQHQEAEEARRREEKRLRRLEKKRRSEWVTCGVGDAALRRPGPDPSHWASGPRGNGCLCAPGLALPQLSS